MKIANKSLMTVVVTAGVALFTGIAEAATIKFKTVGLDSGLNAALTDNFFRVIYKDAPANVYIDQLTLDLSSDTNAFFDFNGAAPGVNINSDVTDAEISYFLNPEKDKLTFNFQNGAFAVGEKFIFGVDTDKLNPLPFADPGGDFGLSGVTFDVKLSNGTFGTGMFNKKNIFKSVAVANITDPEPVPESSTIVGLFAVSVFAASSLKRLRQ